MKSQELEENHQPAAAAPTEVCIRRSRFWKKGNFGQADRSRDLYTQENEEGSQSEEKKNNKLELTLALVREMVAELNLDGVSGEETIKQTIRMDRFREHYHDYEKMWFARR